MVITKISSQRSGLLIKETKDFKTINTEVNLYYYFLTLVSGDATNVTGFLHRIQRILA